MRDYEAIFKEFESSLVRARSADRSSKEIHANLDLYKDFENKVFSDAHFYRVFVDVVFYAGFKADTVSSKLDLIHRYFPDHTTVAKYPESKVDEILSDPQMIKNRRKVQACIENARIFQGIIAEHGSFQPTFRSFEGVV